MTGLGREISLLQAQVERIERELGARGLDAGNKAALRDELSDAKAELKGAWDDRIYSWQDCSRRERLGNHSEPEWIYIDFGEHYKVPPKAIVRQVLEALDQDHPGWDDEKPKPKDENWFKTYFATLETNFPEYVKQSRSGAKRKNSKGKKGGGCLIVLVVIASLVAFRCLATT